MTSIGFIGSLSTRRHPKYGAGATEVTWREPVETNDVDYYDVRYRMGEDAWTMVAKAATHEANGEISFMIMDLDLSKEIKGSFTIQVRAVNSEGNGEWTFITLFP